MRKAAGQGMVTCMAHTATLPATYAATHVAAHAATNIVTLTATYNEGRIGKE